MSDFKIIQRTIGPVVEIEERAPLWRMPTIFRRDFQRIDFYLSTHGAECIGMPYARYVDLDWTKLLNSGPFAALLALFTRSWHFYAGMPSSKRLTSDDPLLSDMFGARRYAWALHRGPYRNCGTTYKALYDWATQQGHALATEAFEFYRNDPHVVHAADLETEILIPLC